MKFDIAYPKQAIYCAISYHINFGNTIFLISGEKFHKFHLSHNGVYGYIPMDKDGKSLLTSTKLGELFEVAELEAWQVVP